jgi:chemotaxis-related protein WspD
MNPAPPVALHGLDCWNRIGIAGDRSCPELVTHVHCRNCPVYATAARGFFDRPAPEYYLDDWARLLAAPVEPADSEDLSLLIFRLGDEWLALPTLVVAEVTAPRLVHRIPHRSGETLVGMVNLRGQLQLQISMHGLLGVEATERHRAPGVPGRPGETLRLVVIRRDGQTWVFEADEVLGVQRFSRGGLHNVPSTLANPANSFSQAVISWRGKSLGFLDDQRVFAALKGLGQ